MELTPAIGVGASDIQHALRAELNRIVKETKGDAVAQSKLLLGMLHERDLVTDAEAEAVSRIAEIGHEAGAGRKGARDAYFETRDTYNRLLAGGGASPVALVLASSAVGSYEVQDSPDGSGTVVMAKTSGDWEGRGAAIGGIIGATWGPAGAALGGLVGGAVGHAVDKCTED
jgi:hypothetical protein